VSAVEQVAERTRRIIRLVCVLATALVLAAPLLLGPALSPLVRALGGEAQHHCACGMEPGKCGCPECEHREAPDGLPHIVKSSCSDGGDVLPSFGGLPVAFLPRVARVPAPSVERLPLVLAYEDVDARDRVRPPTPPPRG
jgi:hypothetical protein